VKASIFALAAGVAEMDEDEAAAVEGGRATDYGLVAVEAAVAVAERQEAWTIFGCPAYTPAESEGEMEVVGDTLVGRWLGGLVGPVFASVRRARRLEDCKRAG